jgi:hypothetical protein
VLFEIVSLVSLLKSTRPSQSKGEVTSSQREEKSKLDEKTMCDFSSAVGSTTNWIPNVKEVKDEAAVKHNNADVPISFWNNALARKFGRTLSNEEVQVIDKIRDWSVRIIWKISITNVFATGFVAMNVIINV